MRYHRENHRLHLRTAVQQGTNGRHKASLEHIAQQPDKTGENYSILTNATRVATAYPITNMREAIANIDDAVEMLLVGGEVPDLTEDTPAYATATTTKPGRHLKRVRVEYQGAQREIARMRPYKRLDEEKKINPAVHKYLRLAERLVLSGTNPYSTFREIKRNIPPQLVTSTEYAGAGNILMGYITGLARQTVGRNEYFETLSMLVTEYFRPGQVETREIKAKKRGKHPGQNGSKPSHETFYFRPQTPYSNNGHSHHKNGNGNMRYVQDGPPIVISHDSIFGMHTRTRNI